MPSLQTCVPEESFQWVRDVESLKDRKQEDEMVAGDQEAGPHGLGASILPTQPGAVFTMNSAPSPCSPSLRSPHLAAQLPACTNVIGQQVGGKENPSSMLTILMKSFKHLRPEYLLGEGNIIILIISVTTY